MSKTIHKPDNPVRLRAYLGYDKAGELAMFVSTAPLNPIGTRLEKGSSFPDVFRDFCQCNTWDYAAAALKDMQEYFDRLAEKGRR